jgi:glycine/D-amino acid oxidase-like deaminating enzyme
MQVDFIIIGQGLAGTLLARSLQQRNQKVIVVDNNWKNSASKVAAGLMTPLTGQRFTLTPEYPELFKTAESELSSLKVFRPTPVYRMFVDAEQRARGLKRAECDTCAPFIEKITEGVGQISTDWSDEFGGAMMHGAWVDLPKLLQESADQLKATQLLRAEEFNYADVVVTDDGVQWRDVSARGIVFCDGYRSALSGPFSYLPWQPAKGEAISFNSNAPDSSVVLNRQGWALPLGQGRWRAGTNWEWTGLNEIPTQVQSEKFQKRFKQYFKCEVSVEVTDHVAGVRPCTSDNHPFIGTHPEHLRLHLFNGMGPRGTIWAPTLAQEMADHLVEGKPVRSTCDLRRFAASA